VWGIAQLALMGIFFYIKSVALVEDLPLDETYKPSEYKKFLADVDAAYIQNAYNCWIAACLYIGTLLVAGHQFYMNNKTTSSAAAF